MSNNGDGVEKDSPTDSSIDFNQSGARAPDDGDLTRFQQRILYILFDGDDYGLGIKDSLEDYYGEDVNHGRLYPNLDELVDKGLIDRSEIDKRTNNYALTDDGKELVRRDVQERVHAVTGDDVEVVDIEDGDPVTERAGHSPAPTTGGGD